MRVAAAVLASVLVGPTLVHTQLGARVARADGPAGQESGSGATKEPGDALDEARRLEAELKYDLALVTVDREIARGAANRARLVELEVFAGRLSAGLDHADYAEVHFARALALAPATTLPEGTSPKLTEPFAAARAKTVALQVTIERRAGHVIATVGPDPLKLVNGLRVEVADRAGQPAPAKTSTALDAEVPPGFEATGAAVVDEHGNELEHVAFPREVHGGHRAVIARWETWSIASLGLLAASGIAVWRFNLAQDEWNRLEGEGGHDFSQLRAVEDRGRRWALAANVGFGVAAAAGVTAIVLYIVHREPTRGPQLAVDGETIGIAGQF